MPTDRSALIRHATTLPKGSERRRAILAGLKTARDLNFMDAFNDLTLAYVTQVAEVVAAETDGTVVVRGLGVTVRMPGGSITLGFNGHKVPFMIEVRGDVRPFESAVYVASGTAKHILSKL